MDSSNQVPIGKGPGLPFVKQYREERELTILLAVDISESTIFGSENRSKRERMAELSALLAFSAARNGDKVGLLLFAEEVEQYLPPAKGQKHVLRILREILFFENKTKGTNLNQGLRFINQVMRRRAVVFFLSDFTIPPAQKVEDENNEDLFYKEISSTKRKHDLICAQIQDPHEISLPEVGLTTIEDAESGEVITVDLSDKNFQKEYAAEINRRQSNFNGKLKRRGIETFKFSTTVEFDKALKELTKEFDGFDSEVFEISSKEINQILKSCDKDIFKSLEYSFEKILNYQSRCFASLNLEDTDNEITRKFRVIESVGIYVPGGKASYPSTVLMGAAPAIACGVSDISITSPAQNGILNTLTIAAAKVAGIETIYRIGGAQAIAALAIGTDQISKVDKIIGPGNIFVAEAKKQLFGEVGIDSIAGPSEILILADSSSNPETIAWDLMAQSEHDIDTHRTQ